MGRKPIGEHPMTPAERQKRRRQSPSHIVVQMGGAWRLSDRGLKRLTEAVRAEQEYDLDQLGTFLGNVINPTELN